MKQALWKNILSYVYPFTLEVVEGTHNPHLEIVYSRGRYRLDTQNAIYSYEDLYTNYYYSFKQLKVETLAIQNVLVLGLGLGSIPVMLEKHFGKTYHYTAIEIDEEVLRLAHKYSLSALQSNIEYICTDARLFVEQCDRQFDLVCMDIFMDDMVPLRFEQSDFLQQIKTLIAPNGLLMYNRLFNTPKDKLSSKRFYEQAFLEVFPNGTYLDVDGNWMLLNKLV